MTRYFNRRRLVLSAILAAALMLFGAAIPILDQVPPPGRNVRKEGTGFSGIDALVWGSFGKWTVRMASSSTNYVLPDAELSGWLRQRGQVDTFVEYSCGFPFRWLQGARVNASNVVRMEAAALVDLPWNDSTLIPMHVNWILALPAILVNIVIAGAVIAASEYIGRYFRRAGSCARCGYDLRGLEGKPCPECGEGAEASKQHISD